MKIGQVCVFQLASPPEHPFGSSIFGSPYQDEPKG
jgi:dCTP deaminase